MKIKNRLFPYPVLCMENDDYIDSSFEVTCSIEERISDVVLNFDITLENDDLKFLIHKGFAEFAIHLECSKTVFRTMVSTPSSKIQYSIPKSRVNGEIEVLALIVAAKKISGYRSESLNEDYDGESINFEKGAILAYYNLPEIRIFKNYEELVANDSFFTIVKRISQDKEEIHPITYDIADNKIKILVDENVYDEYIKYRSNQNLESVFHSLLVLPALVYMIDVLRNETVERYEQFYWYQKIKQSLKAQNLNFEEILDGEKSNVEIAQEMLLLPINKAFVGLSKAIED